MSAAATEPSVLSFNEPEGLRPRGTLIVIPGRGEQPAVYNRFGQRLANDAYRVHVVADPTTDPELTTSQIKDLLADAPAPAVLVGSDTGALFAAVLVAEERLEEIVEQQDPVGLAHAAEPENVVERSKVAGLVLAGLPGAEGPDAASTASHTESDESDPDVASDPDGKASDAWESELDARTTCPAHRGRISDRLVRRGALYHQVPTEWLEQAPLTRVELPILGLHGQADPISWLEHARESILASPRAEFVSVAGARHDVLNDQTHRTVAATTVLWLERLRADNDLAPIAYAEPSLAADHAAHAELAGAHAEPTGAHAEPAGAHVA